MDLHQLRYAVALAEIAMRGAQLATIAGMVEAGMGLSIVPEMMRRTDRSPTNRVYLPFADAAPRREIAVAWSLLRYRTHASRALVELLREHLAAARTRT
ncbi:MAG: LysR family transcriptional regulator substrate-binding protein [Tepidisphaeraceae bacterium]